MPLCPECGDILPDCGCDKPSMTVDEAYETLRQAIGCSADLEKCLQVLMNAIEQPNGA